MQVAGTVVYLTAIAVMLFWVIVGARDGLGVVYATLGRAGTLLGSLVTMVCIVVGVLLHSRGRSRLCRRLQESDGRLCPRCHYNLTGLTDEGHCPECGEPYSPDRLAEAWRRALRPPWR
jgi:RNA polymerase subunit RPABC4/transcription elongation factor Spt4